MIRCVHNVPHHNCIVPVASFCHLARFLWESRFVQPPWHMPASLTYSVHRHVLSTPVGQDASHNFNNHEQKC